MGALGNLVPLIILFVVVGGAAYIGFQIYTWSNEMGERGKKHMEKKNMSFTKEGGLKVGVKEMGNEAYEDRTQKVLVNAWNKSGYAHPDGSSSRPSASRSNLSQQRPATTRTTSGASASGAAKLSPPASRSGRSSSPVPGTF